MELAISLPKWSDCHETKNKHIDWTLGFKCDHQIWPWPWPWPWIVKVKYDICYISTNSGPIAMRQKANISIGTLGLKFDNGFDLGHDLDIWIFKVICDLDHLVTKVRCKDLPDSDRGDFSCRRAVDSSISILNASPLFHQSLKINVSCLTIDLGYIFTQNSACDYIWIVSNRNGYTSKWELIQEILVSYARKTRFAIIFAGIATSMK